MVLGGGRNEIPVFQLHDDFMPWTLTIVRHIFFNVFFIHTMERFVHIMMPATVPPLCLWFLFLSDAVQKLIRVWNRIYTLASLSPLEESTTATSLLLRLPRTAASIAIKMHDAFQNRALAPWEQHINTLSLDNHHNFKIFIHFDRLICLLPAPGDSKIYGPDLPVRFSLPPTPTYEYMLAWLSKCIMNFELECSSTEIHILTWSSSWTT